MRLGWKIFLPFSLIYLVITASFLFFLDKLPEEISDELTRILKTIFLMEFVQGLIIATKEIFKKSKTINYPFEKGSISPRMRGNML